MTLENVKMNLDTQLILSVGYPMKKTNAPIAYNSILSKLNMNALMLPVEIKKGELGSFMEAVRTLDIRYICPGMPHKADIIPFLDEVDESSRLFSSVNAIRIDDDGKSHGIGMDGKGAVSAVVNIGAQLANKNVVMLGAGSISGVIGKELADRGVANLSIFNRDGEKAQQLANVLNRHTSMKTSASPLEMDVLKRACKTADVFFQATPLGMNGYANEFDDLGFVDALPDECFVMDVVLSPPMTKFREKADRRGLRSVGGMYMILEQMELIFGYLFDVKVGSEEKQICAAALCNHLGIPVEKIK